ncbi:phage head closure protein [Luteimonas sp. e5]
MSFTAQELNTRVEFQDYVEVIGERGGVTYEWETFGTDVAKVEPLVGNEYFQGNLINNNHKAKVTLRWRDDIRPKHRVVFNGLPWNIVSTMNIKNRNRELLLMVEAPESERIE